jgi:hypothetical protein
MLIVPISLETAASAEQIDAQLLSDYHKQHKECQYSQRIQRVRPPGEGWYCVDKHPSWRTDINHEWRDYQRQARQLREYLTAIYISEMRRNLVDRWSGVARCESGGNWSINTGNGYYGGLQFSLGTWSAYGGQGRPDQQPAWYQATIADRVRTQSGLHHWPHCGAYYG